MKAFEEYREKATSRELGCPDLVWKAALKWVLTWENDPESVEVIERELGNESI